MCDKSCMSKCSGNDCSQSKVIETLRSEIYELSKELTNLKIKLDKTDKADDFKTLEQTTDQIDTKKFWSEEVKPVSLWNKVLCLLRLK